MESKTLFDELASHMLQGIMTHEQLMNCYLFLGLEGYAKCHEYHYLDETKGLIELTKFYCDTHRSIPKTVTIINPGLIPESWYESTKEDVDIKTRTEAIVAAFDEWVNWERSTKEFYDSSYKSLLSINDIESAIFLSGYIKDVNEELAYAMNERVSKLAIKFDMVSIMEEQDSLVKTFTKKIKKLY